MRRVMLWTTAGAILALSAGPLMARDGGEGRGGEGRGGEGRGGEVQHAAGGEIHGAAPNGAHVEAHGNTAIEPSHAVAPREAEHGAAHGSERFDAGHHPDFVRDGRHGEDWRYRYDNGIWWYYLPGNQWSYYNNGSWLDYSNDNGTYAADGAAATAEVPSDPRYYWYNNQWWYLLPGNRWSFYDHGGWRDGAPGMGPQRRETGYRGLNNSGQPGAVHVEGTEGRHEDSSVIQSHGPVNVAPHVDAPHAEPTRGNTAPEAEHAGPRK